MEEEEEGEKGVLLAESVLLLVVGGGAVHGSLDQASGIWDMRGVVDGVGCVGEGLERRVWILGEICAVQEVVKVGRFGITVKSLEVLQSMDR